MIELNIEQKELKREIHHWMKSPNKPYYYYSGEAGTGKTTVFASVLEDLGLWNTARYRACAYVGKAALVLMRKGMIASTIHALIYDVVFVMKEKDYIDSNGALRTKKVRSLEFRKKESLPDDIVLIFADEMAMINDKIIKDLLSFGVPVIFSGDMQQLPPVFGTNSLAAHPDFILRQLMRQAENDPIVYLARRALRGLSLELGSYGESSVVSSYEISRQLLDYDAIICAKNKTRDYLNTKIREDVIGATKPLILGEKLLCRQNNWDECLDGIYLTNGLVGYVKDYDLSNLYKNVAYIDFQPDFMDKMFETIEIDYTYLKSPYQQRKEYGYTELNKFEYGYVITGHLSQGSEYDNVLYLDEPFFDRELKKHLDYTAITRAKKSIRIIADQNRQKAARVYVPWDYD